MPRQATNILLDFFLLIGACCGVRCLVVPWLLVSMLQLILLGCPTVIFFSLLGTYLLLQGQFLLSLVSFSTPTFLVLVAMAVWLTVLAAYWALGSKAAQDCYKVAHCSRKTRHRTPDYGDHGAGHAAAANNVHLYPTLPMAWTLQQDCTVLGCTVLYCNVLYPTLPMA